MTSAAQLAERLRGAREACGMTQQQVADALGVPRTALSKLEGGTRAVSTLELTKLVDLYAFPTSYFLASDDAPPEDVAQVLLRAIPEMTRDPEVGNALRFGAALYRQGASLRRLLGRRAEPIVPDYSASMSSTSDAIRQGENIAAEERRRLGLGDVPISSMADLVGNQGIWVSGAHLPEDLSGVFVSHATIGLGMFLNRRHGAVRRRFACAHEYAHALFDRGRTVTASRRDNASERSETRANAFAAAFLMPVEGVARQLGRDGKGRPSRHARTFLDVANDVAAGAVVRERSGSQRITYADVAELALHFKVGFRAAVWRLESLRHTSKAESSALLAQSEVANRYVRMLDGNRPTAGAASQPVRDSSPDSGRKARHDRALRSRLVRLAIEAFRQEVISRGRLLDIGRKLDIDEDELLDLAWAARPY
ncbi:helix-turn-helix domain-containing protein [Candidatus Palauibacter sp.]|uniref:helix-turn-helix domain-containing protein n=1 Tax=Candidatus Palauibacter sp. TaxID=3101350 RepID=UPI003B011C1F